MAESHRPPALAFVKAEGEQAAEARELALAVFDATAAPADLAEARRLPDGLRATGGELWVLSVRGLTAGTIGVRPGPGGVAQLCWWTVAPGQRGVGLGEWMLSQVVRWAREQGRSGVSALVDAANAPAVAALRAERFRPLEGDEPGEAKGLQTFMRVFA